MQSETLSLPRACHQKLLAAIAVATGEADPSKLVDRCIDLFLGTGFALVPIVSERILRSHKALVLPPLAAATLSPLDNLGPDVLESVRMYSLLTGLCALAIRSDLMPESEGLATLFLHASETTLRLYASQDLAAPSSISVSVRIFQASCHHSVGNSNLAWHSLDEAVRLVIQMRLYDERSYEGLEPTEAKLRRYVFWHLCSGDRSACLLNGRPLQLDEFRLQVSFTTLRHFDKMPPLLDPDRAEHQGPFEDLLIQAFQKDLEIWDLGQEILFAIRLFVASSLRSGGGGEITLMQERALSELYFRFLSILDDCPTHILSPSTVHTADQKSTEYQRQVFWVQKANIMITYHYLRVKILDRFIDAELTHLLEVSSSPQFFAWKRVEIGHDLLGLVTDIPFEALKANGEPCVGPLHSFVFAHANLHPLWV